MKRPIESDYTSHVAYARALENYCDALPAPVQQEPCGWQFFQDGKWHNGMETNNHRANTESAGFLVRDVYSSPPAAQRQWVGLTDEDDVVDMARDEFGVRYCAMPVSEHRIKCFARAIEAKLKEKNT
jgi:hypothetical protein